MIRHRLHLPENVFPSLAPLSLVLLLTCLLLLLEDVTAVPYRVNEKPNGVAQVFIPGSPPCQPAPVSHLHQRLPSLSVSSRTAMVPADSRQDLSQLAALPDSSSDPSVKHTRRRRRKKKHKRKRRKHRTSPKPDTESSTPQDPSGSSSKFWEAVQRSRKSKDMPSWQCQLLEFYKEMPPDFFPRFVRTGACVSTKCLHGLYSCVPHYYPVVVMRRSKKSCVPLPLEGTDAVYEEAWEYVEHQVVVGCSCRPVGRPAVLSPEEESQENNFDLYSRLTSWKITTP